MDPSSAVLAWQLTVACDLAKLCDRLVVITHRAAPIELPPNMTVLSFPNRWLRAPLRWFGGRWWLNAWVFAVCRREAVNAVFIHMNMEWAYRLKPCFAALKLPVLVWYAHGTVSHRLRAALLCATRVVTSTPEGFRIPSPKVHVIGQGIDTATFSCPPLREPRAEIVYAGRIYGSKRIELVVEAFHEVVTRRPDTPFGLRVIGRALTAEDEAYFERVRNMVISRGLDTRVHFEGHVPAHEIPAYYGSAFLHLNVSTTGSMDKTVLESLACGCPVLTSNEAFASMFRDHPRFVITDERPDAIALRVLDAYDRRDLEDRSALRALVVGRHDVVSFARRIYTQLQGLLVSTTGELRRSAA